MTGPVPPLPVSVDLAGLLAGPAHDPGAHWAHAGRDLDVNVVRLPADAGIERHVNREVEVLVVVLAGSGTATVDGETVGLEPLSLVVIPAGAARAITAGQHGLDYVSTHRVRAPMGIGPAAR